LIFPTSRSLFDLEKKLVQGDGAVSENESSFKLAFAIPLLARLARVGYTRQNIFAQVVLFARGFMTEEITPELFNHLVELAALELSAEEGEYLRKQLNNQLKAIHELESIPLDPSTPVASHGVPYTPGSSPAIREDILAPYPASEKLLTGAPETEDNYFVVPDIPHQDLK
jgi:aspartyl-tRNA(Asn)/glutamyl-tRNA(Gln) amidotransferase subunit C